MNLFERHRIELEVKLHAPGGRGNMIFYRGERALLLEIVARLEDRVAALEAKAQGSKAAT